MKTVTIDKLSNYEGKDVELKGWVYNTRNVGKIWFVIFRDGTGLLQGVVVKGEATDESFALENDLNQDKTKHTGRLSDRCLIGGISQEDVLNQC